MSYVLYYSNYCQNSKSIISTIVKDLENPRGIHWICIDSRKVEGKTTYVILSNGNKIIIPDAINRVPAMLSLQDYRITYGADIISSLKNIFIQSNAASNHQAMTNIVDSNRQSQLARDYPSNTKQTPPARIDIETEPASYSLGRTGLFTGNVVSDQYSSWEIAPEQLLATGDGGVMQMHNYVNTQYMDNITQSPEVSSRTSRIPNSVTVESLQQQRSMDLNNMRTGAK